MEFLFSCSTLYLTCSLRSLLKYQVEHSKRHSIQYCSGESYQGTCLVWVQNGYRLGTRTWNILVTEFLESLFFLTSFENAYQWNASKMETQQHRMDSKPIWNEYGMHKEWERELVWNGNKMRFVKLSLLAWFWSVLYLCMPMYYSLYIKHSWLNAHVWICTAVQIQN